MNIKLSHKFYFLIIIAITGFTLIGYSFHILQKSRIASITTYSNSLRLGDITNETEILILRAEGHEKDFIQSRSLDSVISFRNSLTLVQNNIETLLEFADNISEIDIANKLNSLIKQYAASFDDLVKTWEEFGLNHESGLHGDLRSSVHNIEETLKQHNEIHLENSILMMRRHEKDYMARKSDKYINKMVEEQVRFYGLLKNSRLSKNDKTEISSKMDLYIASFLAIPPIHKKISTLDKNQFNIVKKINTSLDKLIETRNLLLEKSNTADQLSNSKTISVFYTVLIVTSLSVIVLMMLMENSILKSIRRASRIADSMAGGNLDNAITAVSKDEIGQLFSALDTMQSNLSKRIEDYSKLATTVNDRIRQALDNASASVIVSDNNSEIIYINNTAQDMFAKAESSIRRDVQNFDANIILGQDIDSFHENLTRRSSKLSDLTNTIESTFKVGGHTFKFSASPVIDSENSQRIGTVVEWEDCTAELNVENDIQSLVESALAGDLSQRISLRGKTGFIEHLSQGINSLVDVSEQVLNDTIRVLSAMSAGDLTETITTEYRGAFNQLKNDANNTIGKMTEIVDQIKSTSHTVNTAAEEISKGNHNLSQRTELQASNLEQTSSNMEEMTSTVQQNADNAKEANQLAIETRKQAQRGGEVVNEAISAMHMINESSNKISDIIGVIDEISYQTNLLALNAAVEAARAGEQGRGFGIVANEVRSLAGRSAAAAKQIKKLIEDSVSNVEEGSKLVNHSGITLNEIMGGIEKVTNIVGKIAEASHEQATGIRQISKAILAMDQTTQKNTALVEEAAAAAQSMSVQSNELNNLVGFFKVKKEITSIPHLTDNRVSTLTERRSKNRPWSTASQPYIPH